MTPERITGLAALLLDTRDWLEETDPGSLDAALIEAVVDALARQRQRLVDEGAK